MSCLSDGAAKGATAAGLLAAGCTVTGVATAGVAGRLAGAGGRVKTLFADAGTVCVLSFGNGSTVTGFGLIVTGFAVFGLVSFKPIGCCGALFWMIAGLPISVEGGVIGSLFTRGEPAGAVMFSALEAGVLAFVSALAEGIGPHSAEVRFVEMQTIPARLLLLLPSSPLPLSATKRG